MAISSVLYSSESEMWETPKELFKRLDRSFTSLQMSVL